MCRGTTARGHGKTMASTPQEERPWGNQPCDTCSGTSRLWTWEQELVSLNPAATLGTGCTTPSAQAFEERSEVTDVGLRACLGRKGA